MTVGIQGRKFVQQPDEMRPYDLSDDLASAFEPRSDTPVSATVSAVGLDVSITLSGMSLLLTVGGGVNGGVYDGTVLVTTDAGLVEEFDFVVKVRATPAQFNDVADAGATQSYAAQAKGSADAASDSAAQASESAGTASTKAEEAATDAETASTKAGEAAQSATKAATSAGTATTKAGEAAGSASTATTKAGEAAQSATQAATSAGTAVTKASEASASSAAAAGSAATASTKAAEATTAAADSAAARDAALIQSGVYATEAAGRAAVADGQAFKVQGSGNIAAYEYRRIDSATSTLIATYPSAASVASESTERKSLVSIGSAKVGTRTMAKVETDDSGRASSGVALDGSRVLWANEEFARAGITREQDAKGVRYKAGNTVLMGLGVDGAIETVYETQLQQSASVRYAWAPWADISGRVPLWFDMQGRAGFIPAPGVLDPYISAYLAANPQPGGAVTDAPAAVRPVFVADINHILVSGQSLSIGYNSTPGLTTTQPFDNLMPTGGVLDGPVDDQGLMGAPTSSGFTPLAYVSQYAGLGETVGLGGANMARKLVNDGEPGNSYQLLVSNNGRGATAIAPLSKGGSTGNYESGIQQCALYRARANSLAKTYALQAIWWVQGETDSTNNTPRATYKAALKKLIDDTNADLPQSHTVPLLTYQMASHTKRGTGRPPEIALAQLEASREHNDIYLVTPTYHLTYNGDGVHLPAHSTRWLGQYFAKVHHRVCVLGQDWRPLEPIAARQQGQIVDLDFNVPSGPLAFDTALVTDPGNYGFEALNAATGALLTISSVVLRGTDGVRIVLAADPGAQVRVRYAYGADGWMTGPTSGARGCLRDSDATVSMYSDASGQPYKLYNWCVIFNELCEVI